MSPRRAVREKKQSGLPSWLIVAGIVVVALIIIVVGADFVLKAIEQPQVSVPTTISASGISRAGRTEGDPNAPINFVEYSDFQ